MGADWRGLIAVFRSLPAVLRAQRRIQRAKALQRQGRHMEALSLALPAFGVLSALDADNPGAGAILAVDAVFLDQLASALGQPGTARDAVQAALRICEEVAASAPRLEPQLREYIVWYGYRLEELPPSQVH